MTDNDSERDYAYDGAGTTDSGWDDDEDEEIADDEPDLDELVQRIERLEQAVFNGGE